jgi:hypothetical protein
MDHKAKKIKQKKKKKKKKKKKPLLRQKICDAKTDPSLTPHLSDNHSFGPTGIAVNRFLA